MSGSTLVIQFAKLPSIKTTFDLRKQRRPRYNSRMDINHAPSNIVKGELLGEMPTDDRETDCKFPTVQIAITTLEKSADISSVINTT